MQQINDPQMIRMYVDRCGLQKHFPFDLTQAVTLTTYKEREIINYGGEYSSSFQILVEGRCIAYSLTTNDRIHCESYYKDIQFMGFVAVLWNEPTINDIMAITPCATLNLPIAYREVLLNDNTFLRFAAHELAQHIRKSANHFEPLKTRLARMILDMEDNGVFSHDLTLYADLLEISYRHLLRSLQALCEEGLLERRKKGAYQIINRSRLYQLSKGEL